MQVDRGVISITYCNCYTSLFGMVNAYINGMNNQEMVEIAKANCKINFYNDIDCINCPQCILKGKYTKAEIWAIISAYTNPLTNIER